MRLSVLLRAACGRPARLVLHHSESDALQLRIVELEKDLDDAIAQRNALLIEQQKRIQQLELENQQLRATIADLRKVCCHD